MGGQRVTEDYQDVCSVNPNALCIHAQTPLIFFSFFPLEHIHPIMVSSLLLVRTNCRYLRLHYRLVPMVPSAITLSRATITVAQQRLSCLRAFAITSHTSRYKGCSHSLRHLRTHSPLVFTNCLNVIVSFFISLFFFLSSFPCSQQTPNSLNASLAPLILFSLPTAISTPFPNSRTVKTALKTRTTNTTLHLSTFYCSLSLSHPLSFSFSFSRS
ncbi:MAG: hypothetical protein J3R72DRAFT_253713 [Linnemannia gamsii]|nr:MAG: hypothetical protein J3R72DRAFT_253713 [Linnemannia gamsii]